MFLGYVPQLPTGSSDWLLCFHLWFEERNVFVTAGYDTEFRSETHNLKCLMKPQIMWGHMTVLFC